MTSDQRQTRFDTTAIMARLPHRYPFLLVDQVRECIPGSHIVGVKNVSRYDARESMCHLLVVEALAQLSVILAYETLALQPSGRELVFFAGIDQARFGVAARVGDQLTLRSSVARIRRMVGWFEAEAFVEARPVVAVSMLAAIKHDSS